MYCRELEGDGERKKEREREGEKRRQNRRACECVREINRDGANRRSRRV